MEGYRIAESAKRRAFEDTKKSFYFKLVEGVLMSVFGYLGSLLAAEGTSKLLLAGYVTGGVVVGAVGGFGIFYMVMIIRAAVKQRDEARRRVFELSEEKKDNIEANPITGKRAEYENVQYTAWAELQVKNTSNDVTLEDVRVQIVELSQVLEDQDEKGSYFLHEPHPRWSPSNAYWSERNSPPNQLGLPISPNDSSCALIAVHFDHGPALGKFNTPTKPTMLESKIVIEVSSKNSRIWRKAYYIEYHPPLRDEFEFEEWDLWCKRDNVSVREQ